MLSYMINIYDKYIFYSNKSKYICSNDGAHTWCVKMMSWLFAKMVLSMD